MLQCVVKKELLPYTVYKGLNIQDSLCDMWQKVHAYLLVYKYDTVIRVKKNVTGALQWHLKMRRHVCHFSLTVCPHLDGRTAVYCPVKHQGLRRFFQHKPHENVACSLNCGAYGKTCHDITFRYFPRKT